MIGGDFRGPPGPNVPGPGWKVTWDGTATPQRGSYPTLATVLTARANVPGDALIEVEESKGDADNGPYPSGIYTVPASTYNLAEVSFFAEYLRSSANPEILIADRGQLLDLRAAAGSMTITSQSSTAVTPAIEFTWPAAPLPAIFSLAIGAHLKSVGTAAAIQIPADKILVILMQRFAGVSPDSTSPLIKLGAGAALVLVLNTNAILKNDFIDPSSHATSSVYIFHDGTLAARPTLTGYTGTFRCENPSTVSAVPTFADLPQGFPGFVPLVAGCRALAIDTGILWVWNGIAWVDEDAYTPANPSDWGSTVPTTMRQGLDLLVAAIGPLP